MTKKEIAPVVKTKKKLKVGDLVPKPFTLTITHDEYEDTWVTINSREASLDFYIAASMYHTLDENDFAAQLRIGNDVVASAIVEWDEESFGPFSPENAKSLMNNPLFWFVRDQINAALDDKTNFFKNA